MEDLLFWQRWNECKYLFEGMEKALNRAKERQPNEDYSEAEKKLQIMSDLQVYLGTLHERNTSIKELNLEHGERIYKLKQLVLQLSKENQSLIQENEQLKNNIQ